MKKLLAEGIQYAIDTDFCIHNRAIECRKHLYAHKNICIFGTGNMFRGCANPEFVERFEYVSDNNPKTWGKYYQGKLCVSPTKLKEIDDVAVLIMIGNWKPIYEQLCKEGIEAYPMEWYVHNMFDEHYSKEWFLTQKDRILEALGYFSDKDSKEIYTQLILNRVAPKLAQKSFLQLQSPGEYFDSGILEFNTHESYVDAGAYIGDTMEAFIEKTDGRFDDIYCFELDSSIFQKLTRTAEKYKDSRIHLYQAGIGEKSAAIEYGYPGQKIKAEHIVSLDETLADKKVSFIKMDVETFEIPGLKGAKRILAEQKPKLAICAYHRLSDLWEIPQTIKSLNPDYKIYLRQHAPVVWDTVCYAY